MQGGVRKRGKKWYYYFELGVIDGKRKKIERVGSLFYQVFLNIIPHSYINLQSFILNYYNKKAPHKVMPFNEYIIHKVKEKHY